MQIARDAPAACSYWAHLSRQGPSPLDEIDHRQHGESTVGILSQAAIAGLGKAPEALQGQKWMLNFGTHRRLSSIGFLVGLGERRIPVGTPVGVQTRIQKVLRLGGDGLESLPLRFTSIGAVSVVMK